jgi:hypothetical protein
LQQLASILVLDFGSVIQLSEEYYAPGSLGQFNLQLSVTVKNNQDSMWAQGGYELVIMPMESGIFCIEREHAMYLRES